MTLEQIWQHLYRNPTTFSQHVLKQVHAGLRHGEYLLGRFRNCYYITKGNVSIKVNYKCYSCFARGKVEVTYRGRFFTIYCGFEESAIGKHFVRLDEGGTLQMKYIERMQPLISAGVVTTYLSIWYRPFLSEKVDKEGNIIKVTRYGRVQRICPKGN